MRSRILILLVCCAALFCLFESCKHSPFPAPATPGDGNFPDSIASIFVTKCALTGCHDAAGSVNAASLRLDTWEDLFKGSSSGSVVIPYAPKYSTLLYFINTDPSRGLVVAPTMPYNNPPLSEKEYYTIKNWIAAGAPDKDGNVAFASDAATRQKIYLTQQGCDLVAVIDGKSGLIMRMFPIGISGGVEAPHCVRFSGDGKYAYVSFASGTATQQIDAATDTIVNTIDQHANGGIAHVSPDGLHAMISSYEGNGQLINNNFSSLGFAATGPGTFTNPHGIAATPNWDTFYVTAQIGNTVYRYTPGKIPPIINIPLDTMYPAVTSNPQGLYGDPHEIIMTPDHSRFFVTCQHTNEVRVLDAHTYCVLAVIPVGTMPQEFAIAPSKHELFVSCIEDANPNPGCKGSVYVIDYSTLQVVGSPIYGDFYQPHGIAVDEQNNNLYIVSSNVSQTGPPPHHVSECGDRAGWYSIYDLSTLQPRNHWRYQTSNAPYSADTRFK